MKKLSLSICLSILVSMIVHSQNPSITNKWNTFATHPYNWIVDTKANPGDGVYVIEQNVILVPYVQDGDTLYGTNDSCTYFKKYSFQGTLLWNISFPTIYFFNGTVGEPGKIKVLDDGILLLCDWGIAKYSFNGTQIFTKVFPQSAFDSWGFFGGSQDVDYYWDDVYQTNGMSITMGHLNHCDSIACYTTDYIFSWINSTGTIIDSLKINRNAEMRFVQKGSSLYFAYLQNGAIMLERVNLQTKVVTFVMNCSFAPLWDINKLISLHKTTNGFRLVTSNIKDWDWNYNSAHMPTNYFLEVDTIANTMIGNVYVRNNTKLKPYLDEWTSSVQRGDTLYISTEDAKLIKWSYTHQVQVFDMLDPTERIYGTARIALFGDKILYVTNDSILTTIDSIVGNATYTTEHKVTVIRVLDKDLNQLAVDSLPNYSINQFDLQAIDSTSFIFSGYWYTHPSVLSKWSFNQTTTGIQEQIHISPTNFAIYPNPCTTSITISTEKNCTITIHSITGSVLYTLQIEKGISLFNTTELSKGIYMIRSSYGTTTKFIKQ
ncbi:MAG: T9SS type A sorting domain-containing protein [bacterium]